MHLTSALVIVMLFCYSDGWPMQREIYMQMEPPSNCYRERNGYRNVTDLSAVVMSQYGYPIVAPKYKPDVNCTININARKDHFVTLFFRNFTLSPVGCNDTCADTLTITEFVDEAFQETVYSYGHEPDEPYDSLTGNVSLTFRTDAYNQSTGFELWWAQYRIVEGNCNETEFRCDANRCLPGILKCDGKNHCNDGTDESPEIAGCVIPEGPDIFLRVVLYLTIAIGGLLVLLGFLFVCISPFSFYSYRLENAYHRLSLVSINHDPSRGDIDYAKVYHTPRDRRSIFELKFSDIEAKLV